MGLGVNSPLGTEKLLGAGSLGVGSWPNLNGPLVGCSRHRFIPLLWPHRFCPQGSQPGEVKGLVTPAASLTVEPTGEKWDPRACAALGMPHRPIF